MHTKSDSFIMQKENKRPKDAVPNDKKAAEKFEYINIYSPGEEMESNQSSESTSPGLHNEKQKESKVDQLSEFKVC